jgi:hypothetical protein
MLRPWQDWKCERLVIFFHHRAAPSSAPRADPFLGLLVFRLGLDLVVPVVLVAPDAPQTPSMPVYNFTSPFSNSRNFLSDTNSTIVPFSSPLIEYTSLGNGGFIGDGYVAQVDGIHFKYPGLPNMSLPFMGTEVYWTGGWVEGMEVRHCS